MSEKSDIEIDQLAEIVVDLENARQTLGHRLDCRDEDERDRMQTYLSDRFDFDAEAWFTVWQTEQEND